MDVMEEIKEELIRRGVRIENAYFIMGYLRGKPISWQVIFLFNSRGEKQEEIAKEVNFTQGYVSQVIRTISEDLLLITNNLEG